MKNQEENWLLEEKYNGKKTDSFFADVASLRNGTPLAYLIGSIPFLDCTIYLDSHPLIPRTETEYWTEKAIEAIQQDTPSPRSNLGPALGWTSAKVLDLCAGSGAIGVAVAKAIPEAHVDFAEIDSTHLSTIERNIKENLSSRQGLALAQKCKIIESNLFTPSSRQGLELGKYDFILTNPPYIDPAVDRAETSVKMHEPHLALYGGVAGMECIARIITDAPAHLAPGGQLWVEHEPEQVSAIAACATANGFTCVIHNDQYNTPRYSVLTHTVAK